MQANAPAWAGRSCAGAWRASSGRTGRASFASFEQEPPRAAASLGQVHRAVALDGTRARLQAAVSRHGHRRSKPICASSSSRCASASATTGRSPPARSMPRSRRGCARSSTTRREAAHMRALPRHAAGRARVHVPEPVAGLSRPRRLLTMTWLEGEPILELQRRSQEERDELAHAHVPRLVRAVLSTTASSTATRISATTRCAPDGTVNLLDFGCVRVFPPRSCAGVDRALPRAADRRPRPRRGGLRELGFRQPRREMIAVLNRWAAFVYGPLMEDRPRADPRSRWRAATAARWRRTCIGDLRRLGGVTAAARVRVHGPRRDRARLGVPPPPGLDQLAPPVPRADRGFRRGRARPPPGRALARHGIPPPA